MSRTRRWITAAVAFTAGVVFAAPGVASATGSSTGSGDGFPTTGFHVFAPSFVEDVAAHTVSFPKHTGVSHGDTVTYVITDASTREAAKKLGVNFAPRLGNARGTAAVQPVRWTDRGWRFPATVDFSPQRVVVPGPTGFPPTTAEPGAIGEAGYTPLIQLPDGTVLNAPQVANSTGQADKVVRITGDRVVYQETNGFYEHHPVHYVSFDASIPVTAALENATLAPNLNAAPPDFSPLPEPAPPAREEIGIFTNGQTGANNSQRQGLSSALLDGLDPLNVLGEIPSFDPMSGYSPLWDANLAEWTPAVVAAGKNLRTTSFPDIRELARHGKVTAPGGGRFGRSDFDINCPAIAINDDVRLGQHV